MWLAHVADRVVFADFQQRIREPDGRFTGWITHAAQVKPGECLKKKKN